MTGIHPDLLRAAARCWAYAGEWPKAARRWERAGEWSEAGRCWVRAGEWARAAGAFERADDPRRAGRAWRRAGVPGRAVDAYSRADSAELETAVGQERGVSEAIATTWLDRRDLTTAAQVAVHRTRPDLAAQMWNTELSGSDSAGTNGTREAWRRALPWNRTLRRGIATRTSQQTWPSVAARDVHLERISPYVSPGGEETGLS